MTCVFPSRALPVAPLYTHKFGRTNFQDFASTFALPLKFSIQSFNPPILGPTNPRRCPPTHASSEQTAN